MRSAQIATKKTAPTTEQQWNFESAALRATAPVMGADGKFTCAAGLTRIYRAYNNAYPKSGGKNAWDSNHRFSARLADITALVNAGWNSDGVTLCVPSGATQATYPTTAAVVDQCVAPRADPQYGDKAGSLELEKSWVRSFVDERYLWTNDSPHVAFEQSATPEAYFIKKLTPLTTPVGAKQDRFSNWQKTSDFENAQQGNIGGYGWSLSAISTSPPRNYVVRYTEPGGPAALAGAERGMKIVTIDGADLVSGSDLTTLNAGLSPTLGTQHVIELQRTDGSRSTAVMTGQNVAKQAAQTVKVLDTPEGKVGYLHFTTFNTYPSEGQLIAAFNTLKSAAVKDLVIDLRYNGGGLIYIASQMAYMIAGAATAGKTYLQFTYNDKRIAETNSASSIWSFRSTATGNAGTNTTAGVALPTLNLSRVYVLTGSGTASASEGVINGLRGIGVEVILVGATTTGKPYGSLPTENCGITYSMLEFKGNNHAKFGDYTDGFTPTCAVADDLYHPLADVNEERQRVVLAYRKTGQCPAGTQATDVAKLAHVLRDAPAAQFEEIAGGAFDLAAAQKRRYFETQ